jgi:hypothetical protein
MITSSPEPRWLLTEVLRAAHVDCILLYAWHCLLLLTTEAQQHGPRNSSSEPTARNDGRLTRRLKVAARNIALQALARTSAVDSDFFEHTHRDTNVRTNSDATGDSVRLHTVPLTLGMVESRSALPAWQNGPTGRFPSVMSRSVALNPNATPPPASVATVADAHTCVQLLHDTSRVRSKAGSLARDGWFRTTV